ncbi:MAG: hypothetical protein HY683_09760 [Chloroflexi bacterium]|nr:hypothetical protein [Chloroflexota bacterium]
MAERPGTPEEGTVDLGVCIFPHLDEFLVVDLRDEETTAPSVKLLRAQEALDEEFYHQVEAQFSQMLREKTQPFANLMSMPLRLEGMIREEGLAALVRKVTGHGFEGQRPRVAVFLFAGDLVHANAEQLAHAAQQMVGTKGSPPLVEQVSQHLQRLIKQERSFVRQEEKDQLRRMVQGQADEFISLWEKDE